MSSLTLNQLLELATISDVDELPATTYLHSLGVPYETSSRTDLIRLAWANGWRPQRSNAVLHTPMSANPEAAIKEAKKRLGE